MRCTVCGHEKTKVRSSIPYVEDGESKVLRERICESKICACKFNTIEKPAEPVKIKVPRE